MRILSLAGRRLAASIPTLFLILIGVFLLLQFAPGDTVDAMMAQMGGGDAATARELRKFYGLDLSVPVQLGNYLWRLVRLDLGFSSIYGKPVATVILERLPPTMLLMTASLSFAFFFGLLFGVIAARGVNRWPDTLISTLGLIFYATPSFWFGLMAIVVFSIYLQWLPAGGFQDIGTVQTGIWGIIDIARHLVLPTLTLGLIFLAIYLRIMRASMLEVLNLDYVSTARAKGLDETRVVTRHVLRNALLPMVTLIGLQAGTMLGGSVVVESVFSLPGLGRLAYELVVQRDLNTLLGIVFVSALLVIVVNFAVDLIYARLDPRISAEGVGSWRRSSAISEVRPRSPAWLLLLVVIAMAISAGFLYPRDPLALAGRPLIWPFSNPRFLLGTDNSGRDIAAQIFYGARISLLIGGVATAIAILIGIFVGAFAGYYGGWVDNVLMRITEAFQTLPNFVLLLVLVAVFGSTLTTVTIAVGVVSWPAPARLTRAEFLSLRNREFVQAGRTLGMKDVQLILGEILPNALPPVIVYASVVMAVAILLESALAFLRLSDPNVASWGNLIGLGRDVLRVQWYVSAIPGIAILVTVLAVSLVGQGLNDALNPRLKSR